MGLIEFIDPVSGAVWRSERAFVYWLFNGRCVVCKRQATEINHIIPKSRGGDSLSWKNQVTNCSGCHELFHQDGVTDDKISEVQKLREEFLRRLNRSRYV